VTDEEKTTMVDESKADETAAERPEIEDAVEDIEDAEDIEAAEDPVDADTSETPAPAARRGIDWSRVLAYGILPGLALVLALTAGFLKYVDNSVRDSDVARVESMQAAKDSTIALLSYQPDKVKTQLNDARNLLTGDFQQSYTSLINDVVIPAEQKQISAVATVPAAASVSAEPNHAVVLVFVNQTVVVGADAPTDTASSVRVTLDKHGDKWLISEFQPV
jgi:Mce-associated membrane protein